MRVPAAAEEALGELAARAASLQAASGGNLLDCFAVVPDPRDARGIRHSLASVLALCTAAVLCGHTTVEDVTAWIRAAPQQVLAAAGCRRNDLGSCVPPHPDTVVRIFTALGAQALASHAGAFLARRAHPGPVTFPAAGPGWLPAIAADGKAVRGAIGADGQVPYLLAAATHSTGTVLTEHLIGPKTNEVPELAPLLRELNEYYCLAGHVIPWTRYADVGITRVGGLHLSGVDLRSTLQNPQVRPGIRLCRGDSGGRALTCAAPVTWRPLTRLMRTRSLCRCRRPVPYRSRLAGRRAA